MQQTKKNSAIHRLLSGIHICGTYYIHPPSLEVLSRAAEIYNDVLYAESYSDSLITEFHLRKLGCDIKALDDEIAVLDKRQEDLKIEMFENYLKDTLIKKLKNNLFLVKKRIITLQQHKHQYDHLMPEGVADVARTQYLVTQTLRDSKGDRIITCDLDEVDYKFLDSVIWRILSDPISDSLIREIARTDPWRSYWSVEKGNVFGRPVVELTGDQRRLIGYARMYDSIFESPECPPDCIIEDDDMLDGWLIKSRRDREKERDLQNVERILGDKHKNSGEIFMMATNQEEARKIDNLNTPEAKRIKAQRAQMVQQRGEVTDKEFPDVQIDLLQQSQSKGRA